MNLENVRLDHLRYFSRHVGQGSLDESLLQKSCNGGINSDNYIVSIIQDVVYYTEVDDDQNVTIHRGGKDGPVLATATLCLHESGTTDLHFTEGPVSVHLEHVHHLLPFFHGVTSFTYDAKKYHWKGHTALIDDQTKCLLATMHTRYLETDSHKLGTLVITEDGKEILDLAVVSALVLQERSEEGSLAVRPHVSSF